jgi:hypothetical protein
MAAAAAAPGVGPRPARIRPTRFDHVAEAAARATMMPPGRGLAVVPRPPFMARRSQSLPPWLRAGARCPRARDRPGGSRPGGRGGRARRRRRGRRDGGAMGTGSRPRQTHAARLQEVHDAAGRISLKAERGGHGVAPFHRCDGLRRPPRVPGDLDVHAATAPPSHRMTVHRCRCRVRGVPYLDAGTSVMMCIGESFRKREAAGDCPKRTKRPAGRGIRPRSSGGASRYARGGAAGRRWLLSNDRTN